MDIANVLSSGAAGGLFGIIGSVGGRLIGIWETREKRQDQALAYQHELAIIDAQRQTRAEETEHELSIIAARIQEASNAGSFSGLNVSIDAQSRLEGVSPWVKDVLALIRPGLTILLIISMIGMVWWLNRSGLAPQTYDELIATACNNLSFAAMTALLWWFGDRVPTHPGKMGGVK